ncbi:hypothetical protein M8818_006313 [Zalaria obscura]|uniref:Uncharacterized protein n=1 Tax=Zalaria obscura TaxID=2024903 RepID=A0ACC3S7H7_9PEZI
MQFHLEVKHNASRIGSKDKRPPLVPYAIPVLGSTLAFSSQNTGAFWRWLLLKTNQHDLRAASILLNGTRTHLIFDPPAVSIVFKSRQISRIELDRKLGTNVLGMSKEDAVRAFTSETTSKDSLTTQRIHSDFLLDSTAVNTLTANFMEQFQSALAAEHGLVAGKEVNLFAWLKDLLFRSSTTALCGSNLLRKYPDFGTDYWLWDENVLALLFGTPRLFAPNVYKARDALLDRLEDWLVEGYSADDDSDDPEWEPFFGAKVMRRRHAFYEQQNLSLRAQAGFDLIFLAG